MDCNLERQAVFEMSLFSLWQVCKIFQFIYKLFTINSCVVLYHSQTNLNTEGAAEPTLIISDAVSLFMGSTKQNYIVSSAVALGTLLLVGPLSYVLILHASEILTMIAGVSALPTGSLGPVVSIGAVLIALVVVTETSRVRLHGYAELSRGTSPRRLVRHVLLMIPIIAALIVATEFAYEMFNWGLEQGNIVIVGIAVIVILALSLTAFQFISTFFQTWQKYISS